MKTEEKSEKTFIVKDESTNQTHTSGFDTLHNNPAAAINPNVTIVKDKLDLLINKYQNIELNYAPDEYSSMIKRITRCRKEFDSTCFFVLVVGPLKSGKSTFVNILANKRVSPTDTLECTAVPTIIGKASGAALNTITKYVPAGVLNVDKVNAFGSIIDVLRGIESPEILNGIVNANYLDATDDNITQVVTNHNPAPGAPDPIVATIGIDGSDFIDDQIMIIDMPGLDGTLVNNADPLYQEMVDRADFIFFVQSTTSAINEAAGDFLVNLLHGRMANVPLHLIHNVHESMYFKTDDTISDMINRQVDKGVQCIRDKFNMPNLNFPNHIFNFAKISAGVFNHLDVKAKYTDMIARETADFRTKQVDIVAQLRTDRQVIKDNANITKSNRDLSQICSELTDIRTKIFNDISRYNGKINDVVAIGLNPIVNTTALMANINTAITSANIISLWGTAIDMATNAVIPSRMRGVDLKQKINDLSVDYGNANPMRVGTAFHIQLTQDIEQYITTALSSTVSTALTQIQQHNVGATFESNVNCFGLNVSVSFAVSYFNIQETRFFITRHYGVAEVQTYLQQYRNISKNNIPNKITEYSAQLQVCVGDIISQYINSLTIELNNYKAQIINDYRAKIEDLNSQLQIADNFIADIQDR